jgi:HEAT repeat protein
VTWVRRDEDVVASLAHALRDPVYFVRGNAAVILGDLGPRAAETVPALLEALERPWPGQPPGQVTAARVRMAQALGQIGPAARAAVPLLTRLASGSGSSPGGLVTAASVALERLKK